MSKEKFTENGQCKILFSVKYESDADEDLIDGPYVYDGQNLIKATPKYIPEYNGKVTEPFIIEAKKLGDNPDIKAIADKLLYMSRYNLEKYLYEGDKEDGRNEK